MLVTRDRIGAAAYIPPRRIMYGNRRRFGEIRLLARLCRAVTDSQAANGGAKGGFQLLVDFYPLVSDFIGPVEQAPPGLPATRLGSARSPARRPGVPCRTRPPERETCRASPG